MIRTERLCLQSIQTQSLDALVELLTDDTVKQFYMVPDFQNREDAVLLARRLIDMSALPNRFIFGIYLKDTLIGILNETEVTDYRIEVGYAILPRYHNRGYGTEALSGAIGFLFDRGYEEVLAGAFEENVSSIRVMQKSGMKKLDRRDEIGYRGAVHSCVYYAARKG